MKQRLSILDFKAITNELNNRLVHTFIQNFYSTQQRLLFIKFSNKDVLLIEPSARLHLVQSHDLEISHFCKKLREHCRHSRVHRVYQFGYDRIVIIDIGRYKIVTEFFSTGNVLILGENDVIVDLLRPVPECNIVKGETYKFAYVDLDMSFDRFVETDMHTFLPFDKEFQVYFESKINQQLGFDISTAKKEENREPVQTLLDELKLEIETLGGFGEVILVNRKPNLLFSFKTTNDPNTLKIAIKDHKKSDITRNETLEHEIENMSIGYKKEIQLVNREEILQENSKTRVIHFETFNAAADFYYGETGKAKKVQKEDKETRIKKAQEKFIDELEHRATEHRETADILEENRGLVNEILGIFQKVYKTKMEWEAFETFWENEKKRGNEHAKAITSFDLRNKKCIIELEERQIELDLAIGLDKNIESYFLKKKKVIDKRNKTRNALQNVLEKINEKKPAVPIQKREPYWFEKFHWFVSTEGILVIGGRNAQQNDTIYKKQLKENDLYFHSEIQGASSVVCKADEQIETTETTKEQAAYMALCMSKCWSECILQPVFYVNGDEVTKTQANGEQTAAGTFIITGNKNVVYPKRLEYGVGLLFKMKDVLKEFDFSDSPLENSRIEHALPVSAPWVVVRDWKYKIRLCPGNEKKSKIVETIKNAFDRQCKDTAEENYVKSIGVEEYSNVVIGKSKISKGI